MSVLSDRPTHSKAFNGYYRDPEAKPDMFLAEVERGTPGGEYLRRFWHPVAYTRELGKVPLRVKALGEDLVVFKNGAGDVGCLQLKCCHRNASLEFGIITNDGIRCCYHGREFAVDGTCIDIPGDPAAERLKPEANQGGYPTNEYGGIVFIYMGPPARIPVFPILDRFGLKGIQMIPGRRLDVHCNWLQMKENAVDPHHTAILHLIPQLRGTEHFPGEFGISPELTWVETPNGCIYLGVRCVGNNVWVRSAEIVGATIHTISSVAERGLEPKYSTPPFMTFWTLPIDNEHSVQFYFSHVLDTDTMPPERREFLEQYGQYHDDRPYAERQWIPGDVDAQESQGAINSHGTEHLGSLDRGVAMFRRQVRRGIEAVQRGEDPPHGVYFDAADVPPTYANDFVMPLSEAGVDPKDPASLRTFLNTVWEKYREKSPMHDYRSKIGS